MIFKSLMLLAASLAIAFAILACGGKEDSSQRPLSEAPAEDISQSSGTGAEVVSGGQKFAVPVQAPKAIIIRTPINARPGTPVEFSVLPTRILREDVPRINNNVAGTWYSIGVEHIVSAQTGFSKMLHFRQTVHDEKISGTLRFIEDPRNYIPPPNSLVRASADARFQNQNYNIPANNRPANNPPYDTRGFGNPAFGNQGLAIQERGRNPLQNPNPNVMAGYANAGESPVGYSAYPDYKGLPEFPFHHFYAQESDNTGCEFQPIYYNEHEKSFWYFQCAYNGRPNQPNPSNGVFYKYTGYNAWWF